MIVFAGSKRQLIIRSGVDKNRTVKNLYLSKSNYLSAGLSTLIVTLCIVAGCFSSVGAAVFESGELVHITRLQNIRDDLYVLGSEHTRVEGFIEGDLFTFSGKTTVDGEIGRSITIISRTATINGSIQGSVRAFVETFDFNGYAGGSLLLSCRNLTIGRDAVVDHSANLYGGTVIIDGAIRGETDISADEVFITGIIEGDVEISANRITISAPAVIRGNLTYESKQEADIALDDGVTIIGDIRWNKSSGESETSETDYLADWTFRVAVMLAAFVFGIIMVRLFRPYAEESLVQVRDRLSASLATGFVIFLTTLFSIAVFFISLLLMIAGKGMIDGSLWPVGMLSLIVSILMLPVVSFVTMAGAVLFFTGVIAIGFLVGEIALKKMKTETPALNAIALLLGLALLTIASAIPYNIGFLLCAAAVFTGAGGIFLGIKNYKREQPVADASSSE